MLKGNKEMKTKRAGKICKEFFSSVQSIIPLGFLFVSLFVFKEKSLFRKEKAKL